ncbi:hypothetical protein JCM16303_004723 [Sporobolomyces ruberrimus]
MKRIASRLRSALATDPEDYSPPRRAIEAPPSIQHVDLFGPSLDPIPAPLSTEQEQGRNEFERARRRNDSVDATKAIEGPEPELLEATRLEPVEDRKPSTDSSVPLYFHDRTQDQQASLPPRGSTSLRAPSPQPRTDRKGSVQPPSWSDTAPPHPLSQYAFPNPSHDRATPTSFSSGTHLAPNPNRGRHNVSFAVPHVEGSPQPERIERRRSSGTSLALPSSLDSSDSLFSPAVSDPPASPTRLILATGNRALVKTSSAQRQPSVIAPTSVVRWKVDNEKEYELSKSVGKDVFEDALQDDNLIKEFQEYFAAHRGDASLLNLYIDLRSFSAQSTKLRSTACSILSTYFNEYSPSRLQLPISLRGPIIHSLTPLSSTLLSLETAEQDLFTRIHLEHFEGFTQERLVGMGVEWLSQKNQEKTDVDWSQRGLGSAFCLTNPRLWDNPMILVSDGFAKLTGYTTDEIVGLNCRVFQGPSTSQASYSAIREAVYGERPITKLALNYRRNGEPFYNLIQIVPIKNLMGEVQFFLGGVSDVTDLLHPFSTKPPTRNGSGKVAPDRFYTRILLARPASRKIVYATPEVSTFLGFSSSTSLLGLDLLNLLSPPTASSPLLLSATTMDQKEKEKEKEKEVLSSQAAIAAAIRKGETWRGPVEMDCRGGEPEDGDDHEDSNGPGIASGGMQRTTTCILHLAPLANEEGKPKMLVVILA